MVSPASHWLVRAGRQVGGRQAGRLPGWQEEEPKWRGTVITVTTMGWQVGILAGWKKKGQNRGGTLSNSDGYMLRASRVNAFLFEPIVL